MDKQNHAANIILGEAGNGDGFKLRYGIFRFRLKIKPVSAKALIQISRELSRIQGDINSEEQMFPEMMNHAENLDHICMAISYATNARFKKFASSVIASLPIEDVKKLWQVVLKQSDPSSFFFIMISAKGMNKMKKMNQPGPSGAANPSSEDLP